ncbi:unnamed protein product [Hymenolepis diminuta]|uniref:Uncharacterized protein n=2 Tax=Hymenolepis diminuta TaxID=6216 RepID=A0A3P7A2A9_HYMDI|nr:unnamed protein product [Hymenolepis diminuta]
MMDLSTGQVSSLPFTTQWSLLPPMLEERSWCATVNIPDSGVLFIGGIGGNELPLRSTELLTWRSGEDGGGGGEKWQWLPFTPMNKEHRGDPFAVYFQGKVYVFGCGEKVNEMEMLDVTAGGQWTSLTFFSQHLNIQLMTRIGNELFILHQEDLLFSDIYGLYSIELDGDPKRQLAKWRKRKDAPEQKLMTVHLK